MNEKALRILEYPKIIDMLTGYASSPMGKDLCRNLMPPLIFLRFFRDRWRPVML